MSTELQQVLSLFNELKTDITELKTDVNGLKTDVNGLKTDVENSNTKFDNYQKATQWVVNLAFSLIASATLITIVSGVFRR
jgi:predicted  nucleic acid-binding Zn-ribbon protein